MSIVCVVRAPCGRTLCGRPISCAIQPVGHANHANSIMGISMSNKAFLSYGNIIKTFMLFVEQKEMMDSVQYWIGNWMREFFFLRWIIYTRGLRPVFVATRTQWSLDLLVTSRFIPSWGKNWRRASEPAVMHCSIICIVVDIWITYVQNITAVSKYM
jgi:hypothetical protein